MSLNVVRIAVFLTSFQWCHSNDFGLILCLLPTAMLFNQNPKYLNGTTKLSEQYYVISAPCVFIGAQVNLSCPLAITVTKEDKWHNILWKNAIASCLDD